MSKISKICKTAKNINKIIMEKIECMLVNNISEMVKSIYKYLKIKNKLLLKYTVKKLLKYK